MPNMINRALLAFTLLQAVPISAAFAQASRTWVSGVGDDANPCSRTAPCKTFAGAISKTAPAGEINVLDPGGFGAVTIVKSITIRSDHIEAGVLVSGTNAIIINAGVNDRVILEGLDIDGLNTGLSGVRVLAGGDVYIKNCDIRGFTQSGVSAESSKTKVTVEDSLISFNKNGIAANALGGLSHVKVFNSTITSNSSAGVTITSGNDAVLSGNRILSSPKALDIQAGGAATSYGNNVITNGDNPSPVQLK